MFWRKFKLDWTYALGELFIVTAGVLIALALDGWNNARLERQHERDVTAEINLARFIRGVTANLRSQGSELLDRLKEYQERIG